MTTAPESLLAARRLLLEHLDVNKGLTRAADLDPAEVGIVGDPAHRGGYHCGRDRLDADDYSVRESARDRNGLTLDASALDVGDFSISVRGKRHTLASFSMWLVAQCKAGTPDSRDIREVIYSPDGRVVRRWDRLGKRTSGDSSHRWHTHISFHRDAIKAGRGPVPLFRRYLTEIGLIQATKTEDTVTTPAEFLAILKDPKVAAELSRLPWAFKPAEAEGKTAHAIVLQDFPQSLLTANNLATNADTRTQEILARLDGLDEEIIAGLGGQPAPEVAQALVAAGQDPAALAAELTKLAGATPQS
ncbi:hypothetical protein [Micromonospora sp. NPDC023814]|uniref:hypothetical protein n=1 Tax=Micromonospora sp. NPDC023814 TaxID=3154596 RepID=UPI0033E61EFC